MKFPFVQLPAGNSFPIKLNMLAENRSIYLSAVLLAKGFVVFEQVIHLLVHVAASSKWANKFHTIGYQSSAFAQVPVVPGVWCKESCREGPVVWALCKQVRVLCPRNCGALRQNPCSVHSEVLIRHFWDTGMTQMAHSRTWCP